MNKRLSLGFLIVALLVFVATLLYFIVPQMVIGGSFSTQSACRGYLDSNWCPEGYACSDCSLFTTVAGRYYTADCVLGSTNTGTGATGLPRTYCSLGATPISHNGYWCYNNDVYYFNSLGVREEKKTECLAGCTSPYSGATTKVGCDSLKCSGRDAKIDGVMKVGYCPVGTHCTVSGSSYNCDIDTPVCASSGQSCTSSTTCCSGLTCQNFGCYPPPSTSTYCSDSNTLCQNGAFDSACTGGVRVNCPAGCDIANKVCKTPSCSSTCSSNGLSECTSPNAFRSCGLSNGCLVWSDAKFCPTGQVCSSGQCIVQTPSVTYPVCSVDGKMACVSDAQFFNGEIVGCAGTTCVNGCTNGKCNIVEPPKPVCTVSSVCVSSTDYKVTFSDCTTETISCDSGEECKGNACVEVIVEPPVDLCKGVTCASYCDSQFTYLSGGFCDSFDGSCKYNSVVLMSKDCLPPDNRSCTQDLYVVDSCDSSKMVLSARCVDGVYQYINYEAPMNPTCADDESFISKYGLYIAGGIFVVALLIFIRSRIPRRGRK